jgi:hypothetical protein
MHRPEHHPRPLFYLALHLGLRSFRAGGPCIAIRIANRFLPFREWKERHSSFPRVTFLMAGAKMHERRCNGVNATAVIARKQWLQRLERNVCNGVNETMA